MIDVKTANGNQKYYEGFGTHLTAAGWAKALGLPRMTVWQYLQQGMTPEEIADKRRVKEVNLDLPPRKPRRGAKLEETRREAYTILVTSGYVEPGEGIETVWVEYQQPQRHKIVFKDSPVGSYKYEKKELKLTSGEGLKLEDRFIGELKIRKNRLGLWEVHPDTRQLLAEVLLQEREKRGD